MENFAEFSQLGIVSVQCKPNNCSLLKTEARSYDIQDFLMGRRYIVNADTKYTKKVICRG